MFHFLKSKAFWTALGHIGLIGLGSYFSFTSGTPLPLVISSGINAIVPSPLTPAPVPAPAPVH